MYVRHLEPLARHDIVKQLAASGILEYKKVLLIRLHHLQPASAAGNASDIEIGSTSYNLATF